NNEKDILLKISEGDQRAFTMLFDFYYQRLGHYIFVITESEEETEEIIQDVFIKVWEKRETLQDINSIKAYLFVLSKNRTLNHLRDKAKARMVEKKWCDENPEDSYFLESYSEQEEFYLIIQKAVSNLPPQQQKVYQLSRQENLKYDEIAAQMGLSKTTVKKHIQLALGFLKRNVKEQIDNLILPFIILLSLLF